MFRTCSGESTGQPGHTTASDDNGVGLLGFCRACPPWSGLRRFVNGDEAQGNSFRSLKGRAKRTEKGQGWKSGGKRVVQLWRRKSGGKFRFLTKVRVDESRFHYGNLEKIIIVIQNGPNLWLYGFNGLPSNHRVVSLKLCKGPMNEGFLFIISLSLSLQPQLWRESMHLTDFDSIHSLDSHLNCMPR